MSAKKALVRAFMGALAISVLMGSSTVNAQSTGKQMMMKVDEAWMTSTLASWPETPRKVAQTIAAKYGMPNEGTSSMLVWYNNGPWKRTIVYRQEVQHAFPAPHTDLLQQSIDYRVPTNKFDALGKYDGSVVVERTNGEISARCDKEEANFLALNLADDVIKGKKTTEQARDFYVMAIKMATEEGKMSPYMQRLNFKPPMGGTADPDQAKIKPMTKSR